MARNPRSHSVSLSDLHDYLVHLYFVHLRAEFTEAVDPRFSLCDWVGDHSLLHIVSKLIQLTSVQIGYGPIGHVGLRPIHHVIALDRDGVGIGISL